MKIIKLSKSNQNLVTLTSIRFEYVHTSKCMHSIIDIQLTPSMMWYFYACCCGCMHMRRFAPARAEHKVAACKDFELARAETYLSIPFGLFSWSGLPLASSRMQPLWFLP